MTESNSLEKLYSPIKHPIASSLEIFIVLTMGIVAMKHINTSTLMIKKNQKEKIIPVTKQRLSSAVASLASTVFT